MVAMPPFRSPIRNSGRGRLRYRRCTMLNGSGPTMPIRWVSRFFSPKPELTASLREEIRRSFDESSRDEEHFPSTIDPRIYHVKVILDHFGDLTGKHVLDV